MFRKFAFIDLVIFAWLALLTAYQFCSPFKLYVDLLLGSKSTPGQQHYAEGGKKDPSACPHASEEDIICTCKNKHQLSAQFAGQ